MSSDIKKYTFKGGLPQEIEIKEINQLYREFRDEITTAHRTGFYHILWFRKGSPIHFVDFNPVKIKSNSILFVPKDSVHRFDKIGGFDGKAILFTDNFFCKTELDTKYLRGTILFNDLLSVSQFQLTDNTEASFLSLFKGLEEEFKKPNDLFQAEILKNYLHNFLLISERERRKQDFIEVKKGADFDYVILFKDLLENDFRIQKQVNKYASQLALTEKRLNQATSKILGKTPKQMIDERIVLEAKRLLSHTGESIKEIGFSLGFDEPTNFIKYFKKHCKITPVEFREEVLKD